MTRIRSISDIGSLYESIYNNQAIIEEKKHSKKFPKDSFPAADKEVKTTKAFNDAGPNKADGFKTKKKKNKKNSRKSIKENINSFMKSKFDKLFENVMDDEMDVNMDLGPETGPEGAEDVDMDMSTETDMDQVTLTLDREVAQKLCDMLQAQLETSETVSDEEESDLEDLEIDMDSEDTELEDEDEEEVELTGEETATEKLPDSAGHKLTAKDNKVSGTVKPKGGKAQSDAGTNDPEPKPLGDKGHGLMSKGNNKVGNLRPGESFFNK
jgi:hypothetical protein